MKPTKITPKLLNQLGVCQDGIDFIVRNKLVNFPINLAEQITGNYNNFIPWLYSNLIDQDIEVDEHGNLLKYNNACEFKYDENDNIIYSADHLKNTETYSTFDDHNNEIKRIVKFKKRTEVTELKYDENDNLIHCICVNDKNKIITNDYYIYDDNNLLIKHENKRKNIIVKYEYDNKGNKTREYDNKGNGRYFSYNENNNLIHEKNSNGNEKYNRYDAKGNLIEHKNSNGYVEWIKYDINGNVIETKNYSRTVINETEFYPNGQLKRIGNMEIPFF